MYLLLSILKIAAKNNEDPAFKKHSFKKRVYGAMECGEVKNFS